MNTEKFSILLICKIAFTYVGAVIGAGFASGQEIFRFFVLYGKEGFLGFLIAGGLFILGGVILMQLARKIQVEVYYQIFYQLLGKAGGFCIDILYIVLILGSISVMLAGSGTIFQEALEINYTLGVLITLVVVMGAVLSGVRGILLMNTLLIPILTLVIVYTSLASLPSDGFINLSGMIAGGGSFPWYLSSVMYVAFNLFMSLAILTVIGTHSKEERNLVFGGVVGGVLLLVILLVMGSALMYYYPEVQSAELPMLVIATRVGLSLYRVYLIGLWFAMITTAVAHTYGFIQRIRPLFGLSYYNSSMLTVIIVLPLTRFGFANLVKYLYPIYGVLTLLVLGFLFWGWRKYSRGEK